jgi:hypothetical protein
LLRSAAIVLVCSLLTFSAGASAQETAAPRPAVQPPAVAANPHAAAGPHPAQQPTNDASSVKAGYGRREGLMSFLDSLPLPVALTLIVSVSGLIAAAGGALAALWITPRTMRKVAELQAEVGREGVAAASAGAAAAADNAKAAARNAEAAAKNAENTGIHAVARLRQEWINTLRVELAELHSALMNWQPLPARATPAQKSVHTAAVLSTNARLAKVKLLLNPAEVASRNLLRVLARLNSPNLTSKQRLRACRWLITWSQIVLKTEWDRVRDELQGKPPYRPKRRGSRR